MAQALAVHFDGLWAPEVLRQFCGKYARTPESVEQMSLMAEQVAQEEQVLALARQQGRPFVFCDTAPLLTAVYSDYYFADRDLYVSAQSLHRRYAMTLLLAPDLPWVEDGLQRDGECVRSQVHALLVQALTEVVGVFAIRGLGPTRTRCAIAAVQGFDTRVSPDSVV
jgi:nicotinamide riboside kinase